MITIQPTGVDSYNVRQTLERPAVYLDHWAIRRFSTEQALQDRFVAAVQGVGATWLFSSINLMEFVAMNDLGSAEAVEVMMARVMPRLYVADFASDAGFLLEHGTPHDTRGAEQHWMLTELGERARAAGGRLNVHRFVQDSIRLRAQLLPTFDEMRAMVTQAVRKEVQQTGRRKQAGHFRPGPGMSLRYALASELLRANFLDLRREFEANDVTDLMHASASIPACDFVLLDGQWCHRANQAIRRLRAGGITGKLATCYAPGDLPQFLQALEAWR